MRGLALLGLCLSSTAMAADALEFSAVRTVEYGKDTARVNFTAGDSGTLDATATCGAKTWHINARVANGSVTPLALTGLPEGVHDCHVEVSFKASDGSDGGTGFDLQFAALRIVDLKATLDDIDLAHGTVTVHAGRALTDARVTVIGPRGVELDVRQADLSDPSNPVFRFDARGQEVVKLLVEGVDGYGFATSLEMSPWSYQIPHVDVIFASDGDTIAAEELPKLEAVWADVVRTLDLYGSVVEIELWIGGYTDTVGDSAYNRALSDRRARAIAAWFRTRGFSHPIWFQGFGEDAPAVATGDNADEARNRRAQYVLCDKPPVSSDFPRGAWKKL